MNEYDKQPRWAGWLVFTFLIFGLYLAVVVVLSCGCHFNKVELIFSIFPIIWSIFLLFRRQNRKETVISLIALLFAVFTVFLETSNIDLYLHPNRMFDSIAR